MNRIARLGAVVIVSFFFLTSSSRAADAPAFDGEKSTWHNGFNRYDYVMDEATLAITPFKAPDGEKFAVRDPAPGKRRCVVIAPKTPAPGNPWSWRGCYFDHEPQTEIELLKRGFHICYISANATLKPGKQWDAWYAFLTEKHRLSTKPAFIGMSRGGEYSFTWATLNPEKVSCIYADNPGGNREMLSRLGELAKNDVPILQVCGSIDPLLGKYATVIEGLYQNFGGRVSMMIKEGYGHHPHSLRDPKPIADFIEQSAMAKAGPDKPDFVVGRFNKSNFYSSASDYRDFPSQGTYITSRGPFFSGSFDRVEFDLPGVKGTIRIIVPKTAAAGKPWVYRADFVGRDAAVDLALLAKGFHIVTGPVSYDSANLSLKDWNTVYAHLTEHGFSHKPVMEGAGGAAGEAFAWAIENPDKVACIYAENPVMHATLSKPPLLDNLAPLAKAGIAIMTVCGSEDPRLDDNTRALEKRYKDLGGSITVINKEDDGHFPLAPRNTKPATDFILDKAR